MAGKEKARQIANRVENEAARESDSTFQPQGHLLAFAARSATRKPALRPGPDRGKGEGGLGSVYKNSNCQSVHSSEPPYVLRTRAVVGGHRGRRPRRQAIATHVL